MTPVLGRLWAIASMTLLEATRRKVFTILILFAAALLASAALLPAVPGDNPEKVMEGRLRLIEVWSIRSATLFAMIVALFVSGFSLPADFETKRIYLLVTKPVSKITVFLGRYLGFVLLMAIFLGVMGIFTLIFIHGVRIAAGPSFPRLVAYPRLEPASFRANGGREDRRLNRVLTRVDYGRENALVYRFENLDRSDFDEQVRGHAKLVFDAPGSYRTSGSVRIVAAIPGKPAHEQVILMNQNEETEFLVPAEAIGADGILLISVLDDEPEGWVSGWPGSLVIYERSGRFELNFMRGLGLVFFQSILVLTITLTGSTFLSAPVSVLLGLLLYLVGATHGYVLEGTRDIDRSLEELAKHPEHAQRTREEIPPLVLRVSSWISKRVLAVVPDFDRYDFSQWLLKDRALSWGEMGTAALYTLPRALVLLLAGLAVMRFKDFG